jgi:putative transposase
MKMQRKRHSAEFKARVAVEAIKGQKTINELSSAYGVHPHQIVQWKKQALEELPQIFSERRGRAAKVEEAVRAALYQEIGQLKVELDWLKKKYGLAAGGQAWMG